MVGAPAVAALFAIYKRISEALHMATGYPGLRVHKYRGIKPDHVVTLLDDRFPPSFFDVVLEFHTQWSVVVTSAQATVNLTRRKNKTPSFAQ
jgi:hypothetical protein